MAECTRRTGRSREAQADRSGLGGSTVELRIDYGPGYRVYFARRRRAVIILLGGGVKNTQAGDIATAQRLAAGLREGRP
jgi:putative addiction module killer protein